MGVLIGVSVVAVVGASIVVVVVVAIVGVVGIIAVDNDGDGDACRPLPTNGATVVEDEDEEASA